MYLFGFVLLFFTSASVTWSHEIHKQMTPEEIQRVFHTNHDSVPDYEMVEIHVSNVEKRDTRSRRSIRIKAFDGDINLWLEPSDGILAGEETPVMYSRVDRNGITFQSYPDFMKRVGRLFQDSRTAASLVISESDDSRYSIDGFIESENLVVRSLPDSLSNQLSRSTRSVDDFDSSRKPNYHIIFKSNKEDFQQNLKNHPVNETIFESRLTRKRRAIPEVIYPEILISVDYSTFVLHGSNSVSVVKYLLALWNNVDLKFRSLTNPRVRLNIARIIINTDPRATPYMKEIERNSHLIDAQGVLDSSGVFFHEKRNIIPLDSYDILMIMTRYTMMAGGGEALGLGIPSGACSDSKYRTNKNGIVQDNGSFDTWAPAHELGHLLGAHHDGIRCPSEDGYIMTPYALATSNSWDFSPCSLNEIQQFLNTDPQCLYNTPRSAGRLLPRIRPGRIMTHDEQCRLTEGTGSCSMDVLEDHELCLYLSCRHKTRNDVCSLHYGHPPADGTPCGKGRKFCFRGECVSQ